MKKLFLLLMVLISLTVFAQPKNTKNYNVKDTVGVVAQSVTNKLSISTFKDKFKESYSLWIYNFSDTSNVLYSFDTTFSTGNVTYCPPQTWTPIIFEADPDSYPEGFLKSEFSASGAVKYQLNYSGR